MFRFKQFIVRQDLCAMKVGTDGVLLGAWADCSGIETVLDVGTGSGLIALMLAQRSDAKIRALDVDAGACRQAEYNFRHSPFFDRLESIHCDYLKFDSPIRFDLIVSNPPYFSNSLKPQERSRSDARHNDSLPFEDLMCKSASLLSEKGKVALILPFDALETMDGWASRFRLHPCRRTIVRPTSEALPKRVLLEYAIRKQPVAETALFIEKSRHVYSEEYSGLLKDFYLKLPI